MSLLSQIIETLTEKDALQLIDSPLAFWSSDSGMSLLSLKQLFMDTNENQSLFAAEIKEKLPEYIEGQLQDEYERRFAILEIRTGQGGLDAQDWAQMVFDIYVAFFKKYSVQMEVIDYSPDEVGITTATILIKQPGAYGLFRKETGLHRLERKSPFNAKGKLQTSHVSVRVIPYIENTDRIDINPAELEIKTTKSGGPGGQNVNKIESAVIIRHIPTGITVRSSQTRSQMQNRQIAMEILKSELLLRKKAATEQEKSAFSSKQNETIRTFDFDLRQVKDHRTGTKFSNIDAMLKGNIEKLVLYSLLS